MCFYTCLQNVGQNGHVPGSVQQDPEKSRDPGIGLESRFYFQKSRDFSEFWYSTEDDVYKEFIYKEFCFKFLHCRPWQILPFTSKEFFMQISAVDLLANLMKEKTTSLILIVPYVCVQEAESHAYSYCNLKENISAKIFIFWVPSPSTARGLS